MKRWWLAFEPGNIGLATEVANFIRIKFGWTVEVNNDGYISYVQRPNGRDWHWDEDYEDALDLQVDYFKDLIQLGNERSAKLDMKFDVVGSIGRYTILPLPKDPVKQPPAAASSPSVKEGSSLTSPSISHF